MIRSIFNKKKLLIVFAILFSINLCQADQVDGKIDNSLLTDKQKDASLSLQKEKDNLEKQGEAKALKACYKATEYNPHPNIMYIHTRERILSYISKINMNLLSLIKQ